MAWDIISLQVSTLASSSSNDRSKASAVAPVSKEVKHPIHPSLPCTFRFVCLIDNKTLYSMVQVSNHGSSSTNDSSKASVVALQTHSRPSNCIHLLTINCIFYLQAFTGSIVERTHNIENNQKGQTPAPVSKPVSRFKMQRR